MVYPEVVILARLERADCTKSPVDGRLGRFVVVLLNFASGSRITTAVNLPREFITDIMTLIVSDVRLVLH